MSKSVFTKKHKEPIVMALKKNDPDLKKAVKDAQKSLDSFFSLFEQYKEQLGVYFAIKVPIEGDDGETAHLWYSFTGIEDGSVTGEHHSIPIDLQQFETISIDKEDIEDWMINDHGHLYGGYSIRLQRSKLPEEEKVKFDEFSGVKVYEENNF